MPLPPGPMQVVHSFFTNKSQVLADIDLLDLWPTTYVSGRMQELPLHWHDVDNCGYVLEGHGYVLNELGERVPLGPGRSSPPEHCTPKAKSARAWCTSSAFPRRRTCLTSWPGAIRRTVR